MFHCLCFLSFRSISVRHHFLALSKAVWFSPFLQFHVLMPRWCSGSTGAILTWCGRCCRSATGRSSTLRSRRKETGTCTAVDRLSAAQTRRISCPGRGWITTLKQRLSHCLARNLRRMRGALWPQSHGFHPANRLCQVCRGVRKKQRKTSVQDL